MKRDMPGVPVSKFSQNTEQFVEDMMIDTELTTNPVWMAVHQFFHPGNSTECRCVISFLLIVRRHEGHDGGVHSVAEEADNVVVFTVRV
jgi:hypothetical protein